MILNVMSHISRSQSLASVLVNASGARQLEVKFAWSRNLEDQASMTCQWYKPYLQKTYRLSGDVLVPFQVVGSKLMQGTNVIVVYGVCDVQLGTMTYVWKVSRSRSPALVLSVRNADVGKLSKGYVYERNYRRWIDSSLTSIPDDKLLGRVWRFDAKSANFSAQPWHVSTFQSKKPKK